MPARIYIAVFKGDPIDLTEYRHTAIVLEIDGRETMLHVTGGHGFFQYEEQTRREYADGFRSIVANTDVNNGERAWNCQNFVGDALQRVQRHHLITEEEYLGAINQMTTIILEAIDQD
ncbi:hypothetical protein Dda_0100 [Drechslerella dactyloides]|uniref:Uncharacterized protein n=1 Tax=Drechslerella dactyloides TaxID=74499 RepID=A0AAD6NNY2_DREDA|nr:hypothetical protein Dda_0100 [Drechslerella dactyloides]